MLSRRYPIIREIVGFFKVLADLAVYLAAAALRAIAALRALSR